MPTRLACLELSRCGADLKNHVFMTETSICFLNMFQQLLVAANLSEAGIQGLYFL